LRLLKLYGVDRGYYLRAFITTIMLILFLPLRIIQKCKYEQKIKNTRIKEDPIFILGHWRSGTTLLQRVLSLDTQWGYIDAYQAYRPQTFLLGRDWPLLRSMAESCFPKVRKIDKMSMSLSLPEETEFPIALQWAPSLNDRFWFPRAVDSFPNYLFF